jgi:hypothetical protein
MVKIMTKAETSKTLQEWIKTEGPDAQAYYLMSLRMPWMWNWIERP